MQSALLVIDVQRALCRGDYAAFEAERVIQRVNLVAGKARAAGVPVLFIQHEANDGLLEPDTDGWRLAEGLDAFESDLYLRKKASDAFHQTSLSAVLQGLGVTDLVICGLQSEFCVDTTTRRALALGYPVILVADGHSTMDNAVLSAAQISQHHTHTLTNLSSFGVRVRALSAAALRFDL